MSTRDAKGGCYRWLSTNVNYLKDQLSGFINDPLNNILISFWQICSFFIFFPHGKLFATSKFSDKNIFEQKVVILSSLCIILFFSDRSFLLHKSSFEKTLEKRAFAIEGVLITVIFFLLIRNPKKQSCLPLKIYLV